MIRLNSLIVILIILMGPVYSGAQVDVIREGGELNVPMGYQGLIAYNQINMVRVLDLETGEFHSYGGIWDMVRPDWNPVLRETMAVGRNDVYLLNIETGKIDQVSPPNVYNSQAPSGGSPNWAPDGINLVYRSQDTIENRDLSFKVLNIQDKSATPIFIDNVIGGTNPVWSPQNDRIVFIAHADRDSVDTTFYSIPVNCWQDNTCVASRLTFDDNDIVTPKNLSWKPDGSAIAFAAQIRNGPALFRIYTLDIESGEIIQLTNDVMASDNYPAWSPDGEYIGFARDFTPNQRGRNALYIMDSQGENLTLITEDGGTNLAWGM